MKLLRFLFLSIGTLITIGCFIISLFLAIACLCSITEVSLWTFVLLASLSYLIGLAGDSVLAVLDMFFCSTAGKN